MNDVNNIQFYQSILLPTEAEENCFQRSIKIYIRIKIDPTCLDVCIASCDTIDKIGLRMTNVQSKHVAL